MRPTCFCLPLGLLLLAGCAQAVDTTPVWQQTLPATGAEMELSNCTLLSDEPVPYAMGRDARQRLAGPPGAGSRGRARRHAARRRGRRTSSSALPKTSPGSTSTTTK